MARDKTPGRAAAIGNRVSHRKGASIPEQDQENREACAAAGWSVYDVYSETGSASRYARRRREEWPRLLRDLQAGRFGVVVLWESSRGDRTLATWVQFLDLCMDHDVLIHITSDDRTYDMSNAHDYRELANDGVDARHESEKTHKRVSRTVRAQAAAGKPHGKIPFGYRREYEHVSDPETTRQVRVVHQVPHEHRAALVREMATRTLAGEPLNAIAKDLNARGEPTPTGIPWDLSRIRGILLNPAIAGQRVFQGEILGEAAWPAILAEPDEDATDTFARLEAKLRDPRRRTSVDGSVKHLLTNIAICGYGGDLDWPAALTQAQAASVCGATFRWIKNRNTPSYDCRAHHHVSCAESFLDEKITDMLLLRLAQPDAAEVFARPDPRGDTATARREVATLRARLDRFYRQAAKGTLSDTGLARIEAELLPEIATWEKRAKPAPRSVVVARLLGAHDIRACWEDLLITQQREAIRALLTPVVIGVGRERNRPVHQRVKVLWTNAS
jgi:site-specific DNA recombinase